VALPPALTAWTAQRGGSLPEHLPLAPAQKLPVLPMTDKMVYLESKKHARVVMKTSLLPAADY